MHETVNEAFNLLPNGLLIFDIKKRQISFANKEMAEILGVSLIEYTSSGNIHETMFDRVCKFIQYERIQSSQMNSQNSKGS